MCFLKDRKYNFLFKRMDDNLYQIYLRNSNRPTQKPEWVTFAPARPEQNSPNKPVFGPDFRPGGRPNFSVQSKILLLMLWKNVFFYFLSQFEN